MANWEKLKVEIVVPQAATNLVTNPSFETNDTGYTLVGGGVTKSRVTTYQRRGAYALEITPVDSVESGVYYGTVSVTSGTEYTFSVDLKGVAGETYTLRVTEGTPTTRAETGYTGTGYWERIKLTFTATATESWRLYVVRDDGESSTSAFYIDGLQFETGAATTYFDGDMTGFVPTRNDFGWNGTRHGSTSYRTAKTRAGGSLLDISDYSSIVKAIGLGMGQYTQSYIPIQTGGALYEKHTRDTRPFSFVLDFNGSQNTQVTNRAAIINAIRPDLTDPQPMIVRVAGINSTGSPAGEPVDIVCFPEPSLLDSPDTPFHQRSTFRFRAIDALLPGAFDEGTALDFSGSLANANYIVQMNADGTWSALGTGMNGAVLSLYKSSSGKLYAGGSFTSAGGVANTGYISYWADGVWNEMNGGLNGAVYDITEDSEGNIYAVGAFTNAGAVANADYIAKYDGSDWSAVGIPNTGGAVITEINTIGINPEDGYIFVGGDFTDLGGFSYNDYIACFSGLTWGNGFAGGGLTGPCETLVIGNGKIYVGGAFSDDRGDNFIIFSTSRSFGYGVHDLNNTVWSLAISSNGDVYAGGEFTDAGGDADADYFAKFNGSQWLSVGSGGFDASVLAIRKNESGDLYLGGEFSTAGSATITDGAAIFTGIFSPLLIDLPGDPTTYDYAIDGDEITVGYSTSGTATVGIGNSTANNSGGANTYPVIRIDGPGLLYQVKNSDTDYQIAFDGLTLFTGETLTINLDPTNLTVESSFRGDCLSYVASGSDLANFYLRPGTNNISLFMTGTDGNTNAVMYWKPKSWSLDQTKYGV